MFVLTASLLRRLRSASLLHIMGFAALACTLALAPARISWARSEAKQGIQAAAPQVQSAEEETVIFNTQSLKYHCPSCGWAQKCTRNCVPLSLKKARELSGMPCKVCGGRCPASAR
jgi:primosomal protein N'